MVAKNAAGVPQWRCSGRLTSATVFMVAGHCTEAPAAEIEIWFDSGDPNGIPLERGYPAAGPNPCAASWGYPQTGDVTGLPHTHPQYDPNAFFLHDLGVVTLDSSVDRGPGLGASQPGPSPNTLDKKCASFTAVGYGLQESFPHAAAWKDEATRIRMVAHPKLIQINQGIVGDYAMLLTYNHGTGGTCFGDSGGPNFFGTTNVVAGCHVVPRSHRFCRYWWRVPRSTSRTTSMAREFWPHSTLATPLRRLTKGRSGGPSPIRSRTRTSWSVADSAPQTSPGRPRACAPRRSGAAARRW